MRLPEMFGDWLMEDPYPMSDRTVIIAEIGINPLFVLTDRICAVDVLMRVATAPNEAAVSA